MIPKIVGLIIIGRHGIRMPLATPLATNLNWPTDVRFWKESSGAILAEGSQGTGGFAARLRQHYNAFLTDLQATQAGPIRDRLSLYCSPAQRTVSTFTTMVHTLMPIEFIFIDRAHVASDVVWNGKPLDQVPLAFRQSVGNRMLVGLGLMGDFTPSYSSIHQSNSAKGARSIASLVATYCQRRMTWDWIVPQLQTAFPRWFADMYTITGFQGFAPGRHASVVLRTLYRTWTLCKIEMARGMQPLVNSTGIEFTKEHFALLEKLNYIYRRAYEVGPSKEIALLVGFHKGAHTRMFVYRQLSNMINRWMANHIYRGLTVYIGHDVEIEELMIALGYSSFPKPDFNAAVVIELVATGEELSARMYYHDQPLNQRRTIEQLAVRPVPRGEIAEGSCYYPEGATRVDWPAAALALRLIYCPICRRVAYTPDQHIYNNVSILNRALQAVIKYNAGARPLLLQPDEFASFAAMPDIGGTAAAAPSYQQLMAIVDTAEQTANSRVPSNMATQTDEQLLNFLDGVLPTTSPDVANIATAGSTGSTSSSTTTGSTSSTQ